MCIIKRVASLIGGVIKLTIMALLIAVPVQTHNITVEALKFTFPREEKNANTENHELPTSNFNQIQNNKRFDIRAHWCCHGNGRFLSPPFRIKEMTKTIHFPHNSNHKFPFPFA